MKIKGEYPYPTLTDGQELASSEEISNRYIYPLVSYFKDNGINPVDVSLLNIACGKGLSNALLDESGFDCTKLDMSLDALKQLEGKRVLADLESSLPFIDESFECVYMKDALIHIRDRMDFFSEVFRVLKNNGVFYLITEQKEEESNSDFIPIYQCRFESIVNEVGKLGFEIVSSTECVPFCDEWHRKPCRRMVLLLKKKEKDI